ncbi:MAG TPA: cohesin domain-containing protein [Saprospiraceae bacterium]|nr:cohesin domain-containing protein [Saprospiraceae bacterium]HMQ84563.1 cohesin domain-containing protein [Saprospiraceae bacterium]
MTQIKITVRYLLTVALLVLVWPILRAQVTVYASSQIVQPNETFTTDVRVVNFQEIIGCQFSINWDPQKVQYQGLANLQTDLGLTAENFGLTFANEGQIGFQWLDFSLVGETVADSSILFSLQFKLLADTTQILPISFGSQPTAIEIVDASETVLDVTFYEGQITVDGISAMKYLNTRALNVRCEPNPMGEWTNLVLDMPAASSGQIEILDALGKSVFAKAHHFSMGRQSIRLSRTIFPQSGTYFVNVRSNDYSVFKQLIVF